MIGEFCLVIQIPMKSTHIYKLNIFIVTIKFFLKIKNMKNTKIYARDEYMLYS